MILLVNVYCIVEVIICIDDYIYVVVRDKVRYIKMSNVFIDFDLLFLIYLERFFEFDIMIIIGNFKVVCYKMDFICDKVFVFIIGEVEILNVNFRILKIIDFVDKGIYVLNYDEKIWKRVFGNNEEERRCI